MIDLIRSPDGSLSTMRVAVLLVILAEVFKSVYLTVSTGVYHHLEWQDSIAIVGVLLAKAVQRPFESKKTLPENRSAATVNSEQDQT